MPMREHTHSITAAVVSGDNAPSGLSRKSPGAIGRRVAQAFLILFLPLAGLCAEEGNPGWDQYGNDAGGTRYSPAALITAANVNAVRQQWLYRTGDLARRAPAVMRRVKFQTTPILAGDKLVLCSSFNEVIALDPGTGAQAWRFDPQVATDSRPANRFNCRGVAQWRDRQASPDAICALRILSATVDGRLLALDSRTGRPCPGFGQAGQVSLDIGKLVWPGEVQVSSAPVVAGDAVIVGSAIGDNVRTDAPSGRGKSVV